MCRMIPGLKIFQRYQMILWQHKTVTANRELSKTIISIICLLSKICSKSAQTWGTFETMISIWFKFILSILHKKTGLSIFLSSTLRKSKNKQGIEPQTVLEYGKVKITQFTFLIDEQDIDCGDCNPFFFQEEAEWYEVLLLRIFSWGFDGFFWSEVLDPTQELLLEVDGGGVMRASITTSVLPSLFNLTASATLRR